MIFTETDGKLGFAACQAVDHVGYFYAVSSLSLLMWGFTKAAERL
jgi:hypothetical protein